MEIQLSEEHEVFIKALGKKLNKKENEISYALIELSFSMLRAGSEPTAKQLELLTMIKTDREYSKMVGWVKEWWDSGEVVKKIQA